MLQKRTIFQKYSQIYFSKMNISFQTLKEYKINFYSILVFDFTLLIATFVFFGIYKSIAGDFLNWNLSEFILLFIITFVIEKLRWLFSLLDFRNVLLKGHLNVLITKPVNVFFMASIRLLNAGNLITSFFWILAAIFIIISNNYSNYLFGILVWIFGIIFVVLFRNMIFMTAFFMKQNGFLIDIMFKTDYMN